MVTRPFLAHMSGFVILVASSPAYAQSTAAVGAIDGLKNAAWTGIVAAFFGAIGWVVGTVYNSQREDRTKRLQITLDRSNMQISEFYAPMVALTSHLTMMADVVDDAEKGRKEDVRAIMWKDYYAPIHQDIVALIKTKSHLREEGDDDSFDEYFKHFAGQVVYFDFVEKKISVENMGWSDYPQDFFWKIRQHHDDVQARYAATLQELRHTLAPKPVKVLYRQFRNWITQTSD